MPSDMRSFIKGRHRSASPQHGHVGQQQAPALPTGKRQMSKITQQDVRAARDPQLQSNLPSRGISNAQNTSAPMHRGGQRQLSGQVQDQGPDGYGTEAGSIDTTVNLSVTQNGDSQDDGQRFQQHDPESQTRSDPDGEEDITEDDCEDEHVDQMHHDLTQEDRMIIQRNGLQAYSPEEQSAFAREVRRGGFPTIVGDSYPPTTDGEPTNMGDDGWNDHDGTPLDLLPPQQLFQDPRQGFPAQQHPSQHQPSKMPRAPRKDEKSSMFQKGEADRNQQRLARQSTLRQGEIHHQGNGFHQSNQPPRYSQANRDAEYALQSHHSTRNRVPSQLTSQGHPGQPQHSDLAYAEAQPSRRTESLAQMRPAVPFSAPAPINAPASAPQFTKVQPVAQPSSMQHSLQDGSLPNPNIDYDLKSLFAMEYSQLKGEEFDKPPRGIPRILPEDMLQKALPDRLEFVQKNLDPNKQTNFFCTLSTREWEDAGDWFLDQFQNIVQRTKEARQKKRKLTRQFEDEIENRYTHVSKKRKDVEQAMSKMKTQGEGLVPRSPKTSKSPRRKRHS
ncbi:hypothetical protein ACN47E_006794 [Coniothyrium glycines]